LRPRLCHGFLCHRRKIGSIQAANRLVYLG
jgi:hypothetical protein